MNSQGCNLWGSKNPYITSVVKSTPKVIWKRADNLSQHNATLTRIIFFLGGPAQLGVRFQAGGPAQ